MENREEINCTCRCRGCCWFGRIKSTERFQKSCALTNYYSRFDWRWPGGTENAVNFVWLSMNSRTCLACHVNCFRPLQNLPPPQHWCLECFSPDPSENQICFLTWCIALDETEKAFSHFLNLWLLLFSLAATPQRARVCGKWWRGLLVPLCRFLHVMKRWEVLLKFCKFFINF